MGSWRRKNFRDRGTNLLSQAAPCHAAPTINTNKSKHHPPGPKMVGESIFLEYNAQHTPCFPAISSCSPHTAILLTALQQAFSVLPMRNGERSQEKSRQYSSASYYANKTPLGSFTAENVGITDLQATDTRKLFKARFGVLLPILPSFNSNSWHAHKSQLGPS